MDTGGLGDKVCRAVVDVRNSRGMVGGLAG